VPNASIINGLADNRGTEKFELSDLKESEKQNVLNLLQRTLTMLDTQHEMLAAIRVQEAIDILNSVR
jgi:hypothetical protein